jgi:FAD/FMN-containing dehydrogenase
MPVANSAQGFSRRGFLRGASAFAVGTGLVGQRSPSWAQAPRPPTESAWRELANRLSGPVRRPWDSGFNALALPNNQRYAHIRPAGVARCRDAGDVARAILWAREQEMPFVARAGGHCYAGFSTTEGLLIDLSLMNATRADRSGSEVTIGGGALNQNVYDALRIGNRAITHGRCASVGAAGFLLGGGIGFNMRGHGVACDHLVRSEIVTADGHIHTLSATENADLFWACRGGGGGNFGINTSFTLQTFPVNDVTVFAIKWSGRLGQAEKTFPALMQALDAAPDALGSRISLSAVTPAELAHGEDVAIDLLGQYRGAAKDVADILAPAYRIAYPSRQDIRELSYWDGQDFLKESGAPAYYQERSAFVTDSVLSTPALAAGFAHLRGWPGTRADADLRFFQTGGAVNTQPSGATAFVHRDSRWIMDIGLNWTGLDTADDIRRNLAWQAEFYETMLPFSNRQAYQNFTDPSLTDFSRAYYGDNLARLRRIKQTVDPAGVFRFAQAIAPG